MNLWFCFLFHLKKILTKEIVLEWRTSKGKCPVIVIGEITNIEISGVIWGWIVCVHVCVCVCVCVCLLSCVWLFVTHGLSPARLFCPWDSPDKNTGAGCRFLLQGIFPTQRLNLCLLHWQAHSLWLVQCGKPNLGIKSLKWLVQTLHLYAHKVTITIVWQTFFDLLIVSQSIDQQNYFNVYLFTYLLCTYVYLFTYLLHI